MLFIVHVLLGYILDNSQKRFGTLTSKQSAYVTSLLFSLKDTETYLALKFDFNLLLEYIVNKQIVNYYDEYL